MIYDQRMKWYSYLQHRMTYYRTFYYRPGGKQKGCRKDAGLFFLISLGVRGFLLVAMQAFLYLLYFKPTLVPVLITKEYLQLEPIGLVFVFFFALILVIQFSAMLFHRFGTLSHILASTELNWFWSKKSEELSQDALLDKNAIAIVKDLQKLNGLDEEYDNDSGSGAANVGRRKTIHNLEKARQKKRNIGTLDVAFKKRFFNMNANEGPGTPVLNRKMTLRRETLKALETRRNSVMAERRKSQMQTLGANNEYGVTGMLNNNLGAPQRPLRLSTANISVKDVFAEPPLAAGGQLNRAYEPPLGDDTGSLTRRPPRPNQVTFQGRYQPN